MLIFNWRDDLCVVPFITIAEHSTHLGTANLLREAPTQRVPGSQRRNPISRRNFRLGVTVYPKSGAARSVGLRDAANDAP